jgi:hypothetical protein
MEKFGAGIDFHTQANSGQRINSASILHLKIACNEKGYARREPQRKRKLEKSKISKDKIMDDKMILKLLFCRQSLACGRAGILSFLVPARPGWGGE